MRTMEQKQQAEDRIMRYMHGAELKQGDIIKTWMGTKRIVRLRPYIGTLAHIWDGKAMIADLEPGPGTGMTIEPQMIYEVVAD